jgi:hypothetical protein
VSVVKEKVNGEPINGCGKEEFAGLKFPDACPENVTVTGAGPTEAAKIASLTDVILKLPKLV